MTRSRAITISRVDVILVCSGKTPHRHNVLLYLLGSIANSPRTPRQMLNKCPSGRPYWHLSNSKRTGGRATNSLENTDSSLGLLVQKNQSLKASMTAKKHTEHGTEGSMPCSWSTPSRVHVCMFSTSTVASRALT